MYQPPTPAANTPPVTAGLRPVRGTAVAFVVLACLVMVGALARLVMDWAWATRTAALASTGTSSREFHEAYLGSLQSQLVVALSLLAVAIASAVLFVTWMSRVRSNAELISTYSHRLSRGMAVGGWFIPVANIWLGKVALEDAWWASAPSSEQRRPSLVTTWWRILLAGTVIFVGAQFTIARPVVTSDLSTGSISAGLDDLAANAQTVAAVNTGLLLFGAVEVALLSAIVLRISAWQEAATVRPEVAYIAPLPPPPNSAPSRLWPIGGTGRSMVVLAWVVTALMVCVALAWTVTITTGSRDTRSAGAVLGLLALLAAVVMLIAAGVLFAAWLRRASDNAAVLGNVRPPLSATWIGWGCFLPGANLVLPVLAALHIARTSGVSGGVVACWWTAWLGAWVAFWLGFPMPGPESKPTALPLWASCVGFAVAAALLTYFVEAVRKRQEPAY